MIKSQVKVCVTEKNVVILQANLSKTRQTVMKHISFFLVAVVAILLTSCDNYNYIYKSADQTLRYEMSKNYYFEGRYSRVNTLVYDMLASTKGTDRGQECLFLIGMANYKTRNYDASSEYFKKYYESYPRGYYAEDAHLYAGLSLKENTPEPILDQTDTYKAITEFTSFVENNPRTKYREDAQKYIFELQDQLIEKEYSSAKLYYDLGSYFGNCSEGGSNYQACIITAQNAINDFPYSERREDFAILVLRAKFDLAGQSVEAKKAERYRSAVEEFYSFQNEYPESKFMPKAEELFEKAKKYVKVDAEEY